MAVPSREGTPSPQGIQGHGFQKDEPGLEAVRHTRYHGSEYRHMFDSRIDPLELEHTIGKLHARLRAVLRAWITVRPTLLPILKENDNVRPFVTAVQALLGVLPKQAVFRMVGLSETTYRYRLDKAFNPCDLSLPQCAKRYPTRLSVKEVDDIRRLMEDVSTSCWPTASVYHHAYRTGQITVSLGTFYKYASLMRLKRANAKIPKYDVGIVSCGSNEFLHVDTTFIPLPCGTKAAAVFVSDNYSRMILGYSVGKQKNSQNVRAALSMAMDTMRAFHPGLNCALLVADGGSENHSVTVDEYLTAQKEPKITKVIALKDIAFSNSPVEAINRIMKRYIRAKEPQNMEHLKAIINDAVFDYSYVRPHNSLHGLTPMEVYTDSIPVIDRGKERSKAKKKRIKVNKDHGCGKC